MAKDDSSLLPFELPLNGTLNTADDATEVATDFVTLKNLRPYGTGRQAVGGMTKINTTTALTDAAMLNAHFFKKDSPYAESHVVVAAGGEAPASQQLYVNDAVIPAQGDFNAQLHQDKTGYQQPRFSDAPNGTMVYSNEAETVIWGGTEAKVSAFWNNDTDGGTFYYDGTKYVQNNLTDATNVVTLVRDSSSTTTIYTYVGSTRPIYAIKWRFGTANTKDPSTSAVKFWASSTWTAVTGLTDGTLSGTISLGADGTMSWTSTSSDPVPRSLNGLVMYWYQISTNGTPDDTITVEQVTVGGKPVPVTDLWDGEPRPVVRASYWVNTASTFRDITSNVVDELVEEGNTATYAVLDAMADANYLLFSFLEPMMGINFVLRDAHENVNAGVMTLSYCSDGDDGYTSLNAVMVDETIEPAGTSWGKSGRATWSKNLRGLEFPTKDSGSLPLYTYKVEWNTALSDPINLAHVTGIPAPKTINAHKFSMYADNALFLCCNMELDDERHVAIRSMPATSSVFNGAESAKLSFGKDGELTAASQLTVKVANGVLNTKIFFKTNEMWGLSGTSPEDYNVYNISESIGCTAPLTVKTTTMKTEEGGHTPVVIWQGANGIYVYDLSSIRPIHRQIRNFFDPKQSTSKRLDATLAHLSTADIDEKNREYHWYFSDDDSTGTPNRELVFSLDDGTWFEIDRGSTNNRIQGGLQVEDTNGVTYNYGLTNAGRLQRLENGTDMDGTAIACAFQFGDFTPSSSNLFQTLTTLRQVKLLQKAKATTTNNVTVTHYGDGNETASDTFTLAPTKSGYRVVTGKVSKKQHALGKHVYHSLKFEQSADDETIGFEPLRVSVLYKNVGEDY